MHFLSASSSDYANYYQGLWDCLADEPDELAFHRGDLIYIVSKVSSTTTDYSNSSVRNQVTARTSPDAITVV